jgi:hypothetical protein
VTDAATLLGRYVRDTPTLLGISDDDVVWREIEGVTYATVPHLGIDLEGPTSTGVIGAIRFYAGDAEVGVAAYTGTLPFRLAFEMSRERVRTELGEVEASREAIDLPVLGRKPPLDRFEVEPGVVVTARYDFDCRRILILTVLTREYLES